MTDRYNPPSDAGIEILSRAGNTAADWNTVLIKPGTDLTAIRGCTFSGEVRIGECGKYITDRNGIKRRTGLYDSTLIDTTIGDNCLIDNIGGYIANAHLGSGVVIENTGMVACTGESTFGNGTPVRTINEAGGREVPIFDGLSAQAAYIIAMYRHRWKAVEALCSLIEDYCKSVRSDRCRIGDGAVISGCGQIINVDIGPAALIEGASQLREGTVNSTPQEPSHIGTGVIADRFICMEGSRLTDGVSVSHCFIGQACRLESGFMAAHSLFFANSEMGGGEAASVFAGPFTVSHHRSSLLIAGYFLFFNAGSGSNQSNHLFKAGAVHQGIHERGCKFGSNSYIMLPSREGAFTVVIGKHTSHHDTSGLPFSYLIEDSGRSSLHPGANLRSYGTHRDLEKWPARDRRKESLKDRINHSEHNPYLGDKIMTAIGICRRLSQREGIETHNYNRIRIKHVVLKRGLQLYETAATAAIGAVLATGRNEGRAFCRRWIDAAGMYLPQAEMERLVDMLEKGRFADITAFERELDKVHESYPAHAYAWGLGILAQTLGREPSPEEIARAVEDGKAAARTLTEVRREDARGDMNTVMETGYGIDCENPDDRRADFRAVRKV
ncbi:MAG: DUF4954 family protein [Rikenellaceae bacterium]|nr:DUF4954 family protein [Rikenellaceae bacterium]